MSPACETTNSLAVLSGSGWPEIQPSTRAKVLTRSTDPAASALLIFGLPDFTLAGVCNAFAYLDPGTGSILFQSAIAAVASGLAVVTARQAVARFFTGIFKRNAGQDTVSN